MIYDDAWLMTHCIGCIDCVIGTHSSSVRMYQVKRISLALALDIHQSQQFYAGWNRSTKVAHRDDGQADRANPRAANESSLMFPGSAGSASCPGHGNLDNLHGTRRDRDGFLKNRMPRPVVQDDSS